MDSHREKFRWRSNWHASNTVQGICDSKTILSHEAIGKNARQANEVLVAEVSSWWFYYS